MSNSVQSSSIASELTNSLDGDRDIDNINRHQKQSDNGNIKHINLHFPKKLHVSPLKRKHYEVYGDEDEIPKPKAQKDNSNNIKSQLSSNFRKNSTLIDDTYVNINNIRLGIGARIRKLIYKIEDFLGPFLKKIIPNFIVAHYVYILFWIIIGSIVIYPEKNIDYVDALLFASGASTQGGLAPQQLNDMKLYQQIAIYVVCMMTTPIFIHSSLTFIRLYWYEKRFDDIQQKSIDQYKMRRTKTIANLRSETYARTMTAQQTNKNFDSHNASEGLTSRMKKYENNLKKSNGQSSNNSSNTNINSNSNTVTNETTLRDNKSSDSTIEKPLNNSASSIDIVNHLSEPSDTSLEDNENAITSDESDDIASYTSDNYDIENNNKKSNKIKNKVQPTKRKLSNLKIDDTFNTDTIDSPIDNTPNIKFGELPKPKKKNRDLNPRDLYMSISVLQHEPKKNEEIESGPALHIKSPQELERDKHRKLPTNLRKHRKLLKERRLRKKKLKNVKSSDGKQADMKKIEDNSSLKFDIEAQDKKSRSLSVLFFNDSQNINNIKDKGDVQNDHTNNRNVIEDSIDPISTNDQQINDNLRKLQRSHTVYLPEFSKKLFAAFEDRPQIFEHSNTRIEDDDSEDLRSKFAKQRRTSFFGRTFTGMSKKRTLTDISDMTDDEFLDNYPERVETNYLSWKPTVGRNSKFITLSGEQKAELGGVEYQSMKLLSKILVFYYFGFHILGIVFFIPFIETKTGYQTQLGEVGVSPAWWAFFTSMSSFNDLGYTLNPDSMMMFAQNAYVLIISGFFILIGNTAFPIFLRLIIWTMRLFSRPLTMTHNSLSFLLDHPRRCFTLLFPSGPTWWLTAVLVFLNAFDWILFIILDYQTTALSYLPDGYQILAGLYQAFSTRTAGFNVVNLATLNPAIQLSYMVMMYISVLPLAISIRRTNVYEEQSLGIYNREVEEANSDSKPKLKYIGAHLRKQLSFDLWFLFLAIFIICICEAGRIQANDVSFGIFQIMFEVTSAYGTVGLSLGYPNKNTSFCGEFNQLSKLIIVATLIRGKHRGLPNSIDRAIMLSDEKLNLRDDLEAYHAMRRTNTIDTDVDVDELFPAISRAATGASRLTAHPLINRQPTIAENLKKGVVPWADIANTTGRFIGKIAANILTVSGTSVDKYSRQLTQYDLPYQRTRTNTYSDYNSRRNSRRNSRFAATSRDSEEEGEGDDYDDDDDDYEDDADYDAARNKDLSKRGDTYGRDKHSENIPLVSYSDNNISKSEEDKNLHTNFLDKLNSINEKNKRAMQEGSSGSDVQPQRDKDAYDWYGPNQNSQQYP
jgi:potassium uptake Trk family protein